MEQFTLARSGQAPLTFTGELLAECAGTDVAREPTRWHDLAVYRTRGDRYVVAIEYSTRWQGELGHHYACVVEGPAKVAEVLAAYDPAEHIAGYPEGEAYRAKQERMLADVRARYRLQVSRVLASAGEEFAERVE